MKKLFLTAVTVFALTVPVFVSAQTCPPGKSGLNCAGGILNQVADPNKTGLAADLPTAVSTVIKAVLALVGTIFLILTIYAGIMWMTAQGNDERVEKAKEIIKASVIGLIIIMSAYAITFFVTSRLTSATTSSTSQPELIDPYETGCCFNASSGVSVDSISADCQGSQETWVVGACT